MAHYAYVNEDLVVENVIKAKFNMIIRIYGSDQLEKIPGWFKTSYNTRGNIHYKANGTPSDTQHKALRKNFAGIGHKYYPLLDAFVEPQPYESWILDQYEGLWKAPTKKQGDDFYNEGLYVGWDETKQKWRNLDNNQFWNDKEEKWE